MGIGIGIFSGLVVLGMIYLYTQTKDRWDWSRLMKYLLTGISILIALPVAIILGYFGYDEIKDRVSSRPSLVSGIDGINLGDKISDIAFKYKLKEYYARPGNDGQQFLIEDTNLSIYRLEKANTVSVILISCEMTEVKKFNSTFCNKSSEDILKKYGEKNVKVYCDEDSKSQKNYDEAPSRVYDVRQYGLSFGLKLNKVEWVIIDKPDDELFKGRTLCEQ